jgi:general secretion pathway protein L
MRSIGIDIGTYSIKYAEIDFSNKNYSLKTFHEYILPQDPTVDPHVHIVDALKQIASKYDTDLDRFVLGIRQEYVCNRMVNFPFKQKYKIEKSLTFELEDDLPFDIEDSIIHPKVLFTSAESSTVMAFAALKTNIAAIIKMCNDVGIDPDIVSCEGAALSNFFEAWDSVVVDRPETADLAPEAECIATLYLGHTKSVMAVHSKKQLIALRSVHFGGLEIAQAISKKYNISIIEGLKTLHEKAFILTSQKNVSQDQITFSNLIASSVDTMATEVKRHLISIEAEKHIKVSQIYVSGGTSKIMNLCPYLTQCFNLPANLIEFDERIKSSPIQIPKEKFHNAMIAVGLAIEGLRPNKNPAIQFRKLELAKQSQKVQIFFEKWGYTLKTMGALVAIFFVYTFIKSMMTDQMQNFSNQKLKAQAAKVGLKGREATTNAITRYVRTQRQEVKNKELVANLQRINSPLDIMLTVSKTVPTSNNITLDVRKFSVKENSLKVEGLVDNQQQINLLKTTLSSITASGSVTAPPVSIAREQNKQPFAYELKVKRNVGEL